MAKKENFTAERVAKAECLPGKQQSIYWDAKVPGLGLRVTASGAKSYIFETRLNGKTIRITIGDVNTWPIDGTAKDKKTARAEARRLKALTDQGIDPRQEKQDRIAAAEARREIERRKQATALEAWDAYIEARRSKWGTLTLRDHERMSKEGGETLVRGRRTGDSDKTQPGALRPLLLQPLAQIDADRVRDWLAEEAAKRPAHAALAYRLLRAFLNWCADRPEYAGQVHPEACKSRMVREELPKKRVKDDCLQREQLKSWFEKVRAIPNPVISAYLQTALLVGARREEVAGLRWEDIDFQWKTIRIADKVEGERTIPLTPYVASLLRALKARNDTPPPKHRILHGKRIENDLESWKPSQWVFPSPTAESGRLQDPRIQHKSACAAAGINDLTIHGLRRSFGTLAEWVEVPAGVVAQLQGHKPSATAEKHYRRRPIDLLRMWHTKIENWILEQAGIEQPKECAIGLQVVPSNAAAGQ